VSQNASIAVRNTALFSFLVGLLALPLQAQEFMPANANAWSAFAARPGSAPQTTAASNGFLGHTLNIYGNGVPNVYGGWTTRLTGLQGGLHYRFRARALPGNISFLREGVTVLLRWRGSFGPDVAPDPIWDFLLQPDGTLLFDKVLQSPAGTTAVDVELVLKWSPNGQVAFDQLSFTAVAPPASRQVRVAAIYNPPVWNGESGQEAVLRAARYAEQVAITYRPDVMVLGETMNMTSGGGTPDSNAETIPGPSTDALAAIARSYRVNIAFGLLERIGDLIYNTAVLLDRNGSIIGKYQKVQLPIQDVAAGMAPGTSVPVFDTDIGRVGLLVCHDTAFPEPAREAALQGAELLLVPLWGGRAPLVHARAIENGVYVAVAGYDYASEVVHPIGTVLAAVSTGQSQQVAVADLDLSQRIREPWLGNWRDTSLKERRVEPYQYRMQ
jgi:predicted amidohydrolase